MADEPPESPQCWTAKREWPWSSASSRDRHRRRPAARKHGLTAAEIEEWRERFLLGAETRCGRGRRTRRPSRTSASRSFKQRIGEVELDLDILKEATRDRLFPRGRPTNEDHPRRYFGATAVSNTGHCRTWARRTSAARAWQPVVKETLSARAAELTLQGWFVHQRAAMPRPRVRGRRVAHRVPMQKAGRAAAAAHGTRLKRPQDMY